MSQLTDPTWKHVNAKIEAEIGKLFSESPRGQDVHKLGVALSLLAMLDTDELGKKANKTLEQYDAEARGVLGMRKSLVERVRDELAGKDEVKRKLGKAREDGIKAGLGSNYKNRIKGFAEFLISDAFYAQIDNLGDTQRTERLKKEAARLSALDAELGLEVSTVWMARELERNPARLLRNLPEDQAERAIEDLLLFFHKLTEDEAAMRRAGATGGAQSATILPATAVYELLSKPAIRTGLAKGLVRTLRAKSFHSAMGNDDAQLIAWLRAENVPGVGVIEHFTKYSGVGRGLTGFMSLWGLSAVTAAFPPIDKDTGKIRWEQLAMSTSATLSITSNIPDMGRFLMSDLRSVLIKFTTLEYLPAKMAAGSARVASMATVSKFVRVCEFLGPLGDAIALPFAIIAVKNEFANEDAVGRVTSIVGAASALAGLAGGLMILSGSAAATGIGLPVAVVAAFVGIVVALIDWGFGESALTGQIRQDLRYLDVSTSEEDTYRKLATETRRHTTYSPYGGPHTSTYRVQSSKKSVMAKVEHANKFQKVELINQYFAGSTSTSEEGIVYEIFRTTPYANNEFLDLIEAVDARRVADELENDGQAAKVLLWTAQAYDRAGKAPGAAFTEQLLYHCREHRDEVINKFFAGVVESGASADQLNRTAYVKVDPSVIQTCTLLLADGHTGNGEEEAIYRLLQKGDFAMINAIMTSGGTSYARRTKSEISSDQWGVIYSAMVSKNAAPAVGTIARIVGR